MKKKRRQEKEEEMAGKLRLRFSAFLKLFFVSLFCTLLYRRGAKFFSRSNPGWGIDYSYREINFLEPDLDEQFLLFNRVPKSGSELFTKLLLTLAAGPNSFIHKRYGAPQPRKLTDYAQVRVVQQH